VVRKSRIRVLLSASLLLAAAMAHAEVVLVVGANSPVTTLSKQQSADIFMGKATSFPSGGEIKLLDQPEASPMREEFYSKVTGKSAAQAKAYWAKLSFTGRGRPPREGQSSADIKRQVASDSKLIGYIEKSAVDSSVKVIYTAE
jgi:ABC-type phosphate transport system substrate-binding protein